MRLVLAEGDQAGKRCDERARAADIDTDEQGGVILRERGEQNRRGHVTDHLAGEGTAEKHVF